jgi:hypothetical protein
MLPTPDYKIYSLHLDIRQYQHNPYLVVFAPENLPEIPVLELITEQIIVKE